MDNTLSWVFHVIEYGRESTYAIQSYLDEGLDVNTLHSHTGLAMLHPLCWDFGNEPFNITMLSFAAKCGNLEVIEFLVEKGADVHAANCDGSKPLHLAAQAGRKAIVKYFLDLGISANICDNNKFTPLHYAAAGERAWDASKRESYQELVHSLLNSNADLNAVSEDSFTPLLLAARKQNKHIVELFIKLGANVDCCDEKQWTILHFCVVNGWTGITRSLLEGKYDLDLNAKNSDGETPLYLATNDKGQGYHLVHVDNSESNKESVDLFLKWGANVECFDKDGCNMLHYVCVKGWLDIVKWLVKKGCNFNAKDSFGHTPLTIAASSPYPSVVEFLIESGAVYESGDSGLPLLHYILCYKSHWFGIVNCLLNNGYDPNAKSARGRTPLYFAVKYSDSSVVELLIGAGANLEGPDTDGKSLLHHATSRCSVFNDSPVIDVVKCLLNKGYEPNAKDSTGCIPLCKAAVGIVSEVVQCLIESGSDVDCCGGRPGSTLHLACYNGWLNIVKFFLNKGLPLNAQNERRQTPLHMAAKKGHVKVIQCLLTAGAYCNIKNTGLNLNAQDVDGVTPLHMAAKSGYVKVVQCLLTAGANCNVQNTGLNVNAQDVHGGTPLHMAVECSNIEVIQCLLKEGANCNVQDPNGVAPLHIAVQSNNLEVVQCLLTAGAYCNIQNTGLNLNVQTVHGETALHMAVQCGNIKVTQCLLNGGAYCNIKKKGLNLNAQDIKGATPLHVAVRTYDVECIQCLLKAGADCNIQDISGMTAFNEFLKEPCFYIDCIALFIENGAYFQADHYNVLSLKEIVLQDINICTHSVINRYNYCDLPKIYNIPLFSERLPSIEKFKIVSQTNIVQDIEESVKYEIQTKGFCDVLTVEPIVLRRLCVRSISKYCDN